MAECLHLRYNYYGHKRCDLLTVQDCKNCSFFCDADRFEYSKKEYQGAKCVYIKEKAVNIPPYIKRGVTK